MADLKVDILTVATPTGLDNLDKFLSYHSFVGGVKCATSDDVAVFKKLGKAPGNETHPNVHRWYKHVATWVKSPPADLPQGVFKVEEENKPDDIDLFGDEEEEEDDALAKKMAAMKAAKTKKKEVAKSSLVIHIEPASIETNLDEVLKLVRDIKMEGLTWGEAYTKIPLAYGIEKLQVICTIVDDLVNTNEIIELIEGLGLTDEQKALLSKREEEDDDEDEDELFGLVQSATIVSFNKL
ncbi:translation elongation factor E1-F beta, putative [Theileria equi strain WA]|uniref:Translation elongation factor E1-F beta, putative n=1 Tax=Theileria equi strain WA TaxID=1537102 RepID=L1LGT7_THEEQ|nr:translation elongation factor E1-F beta, putative [Theileria equi strain WA]EKX74333.1 translation elongation factor E1-F beta, putative [Theileria equi strain WA]|eukprot:XP_004833785.1 translation elongation factor E1-F beta, putative [Theileria equi strain WA]